MVPCAVSRMTDGRGLSVKQCRMTARPSTAPILTSVTITSTGVLLTMLIASSPLLAVRTLWSLRAKGELQAVKYFLLIVY
jgi:hypothetical protein